MADWSDGYVKEIDYTHDYYRELNPMTARLALLNAGLAFPKEDAAVSCELGFGFGVSANIHAAASAGEWWGTDFNPSQAGFALELAKASGANARLFDQTFAEFCNRPDLPDFDFIGLHGIWSWVSDENRRLIVEFVRRRLRVGGVMYVSYNTQPGWAQFIPLRQLLTEHAEVMSAPAVGIAERIDSAIRYVDALLEASPGYAALHPGAINRIKSIKNYNRNYLAHEYFNRDWQPMLFADFARWFDSAKVDWACSALYSDHADALNLLPVQVDILNKIRDVKFRQSARDIVVNRQFRKDYWIKGPRRLDPYERKTALRAHRVILLSNPDDVVFKAGGSLVEQALPEAAYRPLIDLLANRQVRTLAELESGMRGRGIDFNRMVEAIMVLIGKGDLASVQDDAVAESAQPVSSRLNHYVIENSVNSLPMHTLASPVTGGGVSVQPFHLQMLQARAQGLETPEEWAKCMLQKLADKEAGLLKPDGALMSNDEAMDVLVEAGKSFARKQLPGLQSLKVVS